MNKQVKIIGNGQLAHIFKNLVIDDVVIFASGVSNSNCTDIQEFNKEEKLLRDALHKYKEKKFVYFSSSALSAKKYFQNDYYKHKKRMEEIIKEESDNYYIFRIPQLFGELKRHNTLINFLYYAILEDREFNIYSEAYRYVIDIDDVRYLVEQFIENSPPCITINLANPYRYSILELVNVFESILNKKANYKLIDKYDGYFLDLNDLISFIKKHNMTLSFSKNYFNEKIQTKLLNMQKKLDLDND